MNQRQAGSPRVLLPRSFTPESIQEAFNVASNEIGGRRTITSRRPSGQQAVPVSRHQLFQLAMPRSRRLESVQEIFEEATRILAERFSLSPDQIMFALTQSDLKSILQGNRVQGCESQFNVTRCRQADRYRSFDGTCNNLQHPSWGMAGVCFERLVDPAYADGISERRVAMSGNPLPAPRRISLELHSHNDNPTDYVTHMFMAYGQFLDHDISLTPQSQGTNGELLECCPVNPDDPASCDPVIIEQDDPFFRQVNVTCLTNVRSAMCSSCTLGPRQQTNQVTAYIDASHIYGLNTNQSRGLRTNDGTGTLRSVRNQDAGDLLPASDNPEDDFCSFQDENLNCFQTGDQRANQHPALTSLHTIFLREHNRIARRLREINPRWDGETIYQEARKIVGAEMQFITYNEYLPLVLGPERMEWFDLTVRRGNQYTEYDNTVEATLANEFSTAAFRFGHSMINGFFQDSRGSNRGNYLREIFNFPFGLYSGQMEGIVSGLTDSPAQKFDRYMVRDVTNHLYQNRGENSGLDLASLNLMRGRDHGIPGYTTLVEFCGGPQIRTWRDLDRLFQRGLRTRFENLYERVEDIDLFSGGLAERPNQGAVVGPTFTCILGMQFYHLKYGDRFYFEHGSQVGSFTPAQLREIKKMNLGKIICNNARIREITANTFLYPGNRNPSEPCDRKPDMDLSAWRV
jgi:peroxidase